MSASEKLFDILSSADPYPMTDRNGDVSFFYKGVKATKSSNGSIQVYDITGILPHYKKMNDSEVMVFLLEHFNVKKPK